MNVKRTSHQPGVGNNNNDESDFQAKNKTKLTNCMEVFQFTFIINTPI